MSVTQIATALLNLIAGIGIFIIACKMMSENLESLSSDKLKSLFSKISDNKLLGVMMGAVATAAIQSSGATMVMVIGFVNAGIMDLIQATCIMYGSDIGTTLTGIIVALGMLSGDFISTTVIFSAMTGIGIVVSSMSKSDITKKVGGILSGFGMLFVGLNMMENAMEAFAMLDSVKLFLASISSSVLLAIIGAIMTAIIQSSSVMTSLSITMVFTGLISIDQGIYLTLGANVGSCVVGVIAALNAGTNAKRTSFIQLLYNIGGVVLFLFIDFLIRKAAGGTITYGTMLSKVVPNKPEAQLALFHCLFNIISAIICLPLTKYIVSLSKIAIPDNEKTISTKTQHLSFIDDYMLRTPSIAVEQVKKEIVHMGELAIDNFNLAIDAITDVDLSKRKKFDAKEELIDNIDSELTRFVRKLSAAVVNEKDNKYLSKCYHSIVDFERIGDYAENIMEYTQDIADSEQKFSSDATFEIECVRKKINELYENAIIAYTGANRDVLYDINIIEDEIDDMTDSMSVNHVKRMNEGTCNAEIGSKFLSLASDMERIGDHIVNVVKTIK